ncbi:helix-turn-helix domain-containing protein [Pseudomonas putida]|uniref:HTH cro/C1-type domain-containing protein n=1 Tax=Pseudomonas putida TaxID=303 RepID=A0A1Q9QW07_PSEPU|nr:helix-turn-helix transcriptional regulator [Pseudomonas putida]OLS59222.1 hypothetical protein PSEMO_57310 [Pseudomonas putida]
MIDGIDPPLGERLDMNPNPDKENVTTVTSICTVVLRELRLERGLHQAQVADWIGKTPSAWTKIESGKAPLQLEILIRVCRGFQVWPSAVMATAERYSHYLGQRKWSIVTTDLPPGEDDLLREAQEYWSSPGGRNAATNRWGHMPVLNGPQWNMDGSAAENTASAPFRFAVDPWFRSTQMAAIEATGLGF